MPRLTRKNIKVFAGSATNNGVFGSLQANNPTTTSDVEQLQSLSAWSEGWNAATETSEDLPPLEEIQGVEYVTTYQQAYLMQEGVPEWSSSVTYYVGSVVKEVTSTGFRIYNSLTDNNTGNLLSDTSNWKKVMDSDDVYAFDNTVVHKTGNETITGIKTFAGEGWITKIQNTDVTYNTAPSSDKGTSIVFTDKNGTQMGCVETMRFPSNNTLVRFNAYSANGNWASQALELMVDSTGNVTTYAPTPTDTTSTSSHQIATTGWVNSVGNNTVHKTGDETIAGDKTFNNTIFSTQNNRIIQVNNGSGTVCGTFEVKQDGNNNVASIYAFGSDGNSNGKIKIFYNDGSPYVEAPASDVNNSIVTTVNKSKAADGYFKLGNGLIIQWGRSSQRTITYSIPFSSDTSFSIVVNNQAGTDGYGRPDSVSNLTRTSCMVGDLSGYPVRWIAVGY